MLSSGKAFFRRIFQNELKLAIVLVSHAYISRDGIVCESACACVCVHEFNSVRVSQLMNAVLFFYFQNGPRPI